MLLCAFVICSFSFHLFLFQLVILVLIEFSFNLSFKFSFVPELFQLVANTTFLGFFF